MPSLNHRVGSREEILVETPLQPLKEPPGARTDWGRKLDRAGDKRKLKTRQEEGVRGGEQGGER